MCLYSEKRVSGEMTNLNTDSALACNNCIYSENQTHTKYCKNGKGDSYILYMHIYISKVRCLFFCGWMLVVVKFLGLRLVVAVVGGGGLVLLWWWWWW